jgi:hypothetical protein
MALQPKNLVVDWHIINPNLKRDIPEEEGNTIPDPYFVLRGLIRTQRNTEEEWTDPASFFVLTPPVTGRIDRLMVVPDGLSPPGPPAANTFDIVITQFLVESFQVSVGGQYQPTLDILNSQGLALPNGTISEITSYVDAATLNPIRPHLLIQDRLKIAFDDWGTGTDTQVARLLMLYIYFAQNCCGVDTGGGG